MLYIRKTRGRELRLRGHNLAFVVNFILRAVLLQ